MEIIEERSALLSDHEVFAILDESTQEFQNFEELTGREQEQGQENVMTVL
eukprot:m.129999 g.129999  ORF g.129999 m.129999 type:complete len:50 (+) comp14590_c0_seq2:225-374(+)